MEYNIVVVGATGQVGTQVIKELEDRAFPVKHLLAFASKESIAECVEFRGEEVAVQELEPNAFDGAEIVFFCTPAHVTKQFIPAAVQAGAFSIDLSHESLSDESVPCIVPELATASLLKSLNRVANPPVATIQVALVLEALRSVSGIKHLSMTVIQSASALGKAGVEALRKQSGALLNGRSLDKDTIIDSEDAPSQLAFNLAPLTGTGRFYPDADLLHTALGRVLGNIDFEVRVEVVQAPIFYGNALSLACQLDTEVGGDIILKALQGQPGLEVMDSAPMEFCGTISAPEFETVPVSIMHMSANGCFSLWSIIDNLRKGSALNAVQTAEMYIAG